MEKKDIKGLKLFFILVFILFYVLIAITGFFHYIHANVVILKTLESICSWTATFVILILFKKLYPGLTFKEFLAQNFKKKVSFKDFLTPFFIQIILFVFSVLFIFKKYKMGISDFKIPELTSFVALFLTILTSGATGEELGWRGYVLKVYEKTNSPVKASILVGIFWGFWHHPLMVLTGYSGLTLFLYSLFFFITITAFSVVISYYYNKSGNLFVAMWIHFWFNIFFTFTKQHTPASLFTIIIFYCIVYVLWATIIAWKKSIKTSR